MAQSDDGGRPHDVAPASYTGLRRDAAEGLAARDRRQAAEGLNTLLGDHRFMNQSRWISIAATIVGVGLILLGERRPAAGAVDDIRSVAIQADVAIGSRWVGSDAVGRLVADARLAQTAGARTLLLVRRGAACLAGPERCLRSSGRPASDRPMLATAGR